MRWPTIAVLLSTIFRRDVGVVIEPEHDRHAIAQDRAAQRDLLALHVVDPLGRAGAVELQRQPVDRSRRPSPASMRSAKKSKASRVMRPPATARPRMMGTVSISSPDSCDRLQVPADLPMFAELFEDVAALEYSECLVVPQRCQNGIEIVGFLRNVDERDPHADISTGTPERVLDQNRRLPACIINAPQVEPAILPDAAFKPSST